MVKAIDKALNWKSKEEQEEEKKREEKKTRGRNELENEKQDTCLFPRSEGEEKKRREKRIDDYAIAKEKW